MTPKPNRRTGAAAIVLAGLLAVAACNDPFAAFLLDVPLEPSDVVLFDYVGGRLQDPPAFDAINDRTARVDQTTQWDFMFRIASGTPQLLAFSALADSVSEAGLLRSEQAFDDILKAPKDGYDNETAFPIAIGDVFLVRSRRDRTNIFICSQYMKLEIIDIDLQNGTLLFAYLRNPNCGDTVLEPGTHGSL